ncbi:MAG TPA: Mur ligase family protein, partial [Pseudorhizobium sp.]|nr:Mur ligase family protein [Pseudorhizobium sp.]
MIPVTTFSGRKVALFGLGGSGLATAQALVAGGAEVTAWDDNPDSVAKAAQSGIPTADLRGLDWPAQAAFVLSPGVPLTHPKPHWSVDLARASGVDIIGDVELFVRERRAHAPDCPLIAITGTNGKSTTTALIAHILKDSGRDTQLGGNIGTAVLTLEPPKAERYYVVECSSYQIDLAPTLDPTAGILLNLTPDHL